MPEVKRNFDVLIPLRPKNVIFWHESHDLGLHMGLNNIINSMETLIFSPFWIFLEYDAIHIFLFIFLF